MPWPTVSPFERVTRESLIFVPALRGSAGYCSGVSTAVMRVPRICDRWRVGWSGLTTAAE